MKPYSRKTRNHGARSAAAPAQAVQYSSHQQGPSYYAPQPQLDYSAAAAVASAAQAAIYPSPYPPPPPPAAYYLPTPPQQPYYSFPTDKRAVEGMVRKQIEYYFSDENLIKDLFLRNKMDKDGFVLIDEISRFQRVMSLTQDMDTIISALNESESIEVCDGIKIRPKKDPFRWPFPTNSNVLQFVPQQQQLQQNQNQLGAQAAPQVVAPAQPQQIPQQHQLQSQQPKQSQQQLQHQQQQPQQVVAPSMQSQMHAEPLVTNSTSTSTTMANANTTNATAPTTPSGLNLQPQHQVLKHQNQFHNKQDQSHQAHKHYMNQSQQQPHQQSTPLIQQQQQQNQHQTNAEPHLISNATSTFADILSTQPQQKLHPPPQQQHQQPNQPQPQQLQQQRQHHNQSQQQQLQPQTKQNQPQTPKLDQQQQSHQAPNKLNLNQQPQSQTQPPPPPPQQQQPQPMVDIPNNKQHNKCSTPVESEWKEVKSRRRRRHLHS